jgi:calmodulin
MAELTRAEAEDCAKLFRLFDRDNSGDIDLAEFSTLVRGMGACPTNSKLNNVFIDADKDADGKLNLEELKAAYKVIKDEESSNDQVAELTEVFRNLDTASQGFLDAEDFRRMLTSVGEPLSDQEVDRMFAKADTSGDGRIDLDEFLIMNGVTPPKVDNSKEIDAALTTMFKLYDKDSDGFVTISEFLNMDQALCEKVHATFNEQETRQRFESKDANTDGKVSHVEFVDFAKTRMPKELSEGEAAEMLNQINAVLVQSKSPVRDIGSLRAQAKGLLSKACADGSLKTVLTDIRLEKAPKTIDAALTAMFKLYDKDGSGFVTIEESLEMDRALCDYAKVVYDAAESRKRFEAADSNRDGQVPFAEFEKFARTQLPDNDAEAIAFLNQVSKELARAKAVSAAASSKNIQALCMQAKGMLSKACANGSLKTAIAEVKVERAAAGV